MSALRYPCGRFRVAGGPAEGAVIEGRLQQHGLPGQFWRSLGAGSEIHPAPPIGLTLRETFKTQGRDVPQIKWAIKWVSLR